MQQYWNIIENYSIILTNVFFQYCSWKISWCNYCYRHVDFGIRPVLYWIKLSIWRKLPDINQTDGIWTKIIGGTGFNANLVWSTTSTFCLINISNFLHLQTNCTNSADNGKHDILYLTACWGYIQSSSNLFICCLFIDIIFIFCIG